MTTFINYGQSLERHPELVSGSFFESVISRQEAILYRCKCACL